MRRVGFSVCFLLTLLVLTLPLGAQVRDDAGFFTSNAVERANQLISQMRQQTRHELRVETIPSVPSNLQDELRSMGSDRFFSQYTAQMARQAGVDGVYVLVCREPTYLKVAVGDGTQRAGLFSNADRDQLANSLLTSFRARNFDQGLLDAVGFVQRTMTTNAQRGSAAGAASSDGTLRTFPTAPQAQPRTGTPAPSTPVPQPQRQSSGRGMFFWLIVIGGGLFLLMFILRKLAARASGMGGSAYDRQNVPPPLPGNPPTYGQSYPGYGAGGAPMGGGGFGRGILGGLLGGAAGGWLYDRMSHRHDAGASGYPGQGAPPAQSNPDPFSSASPDRDYSVSSGGDFSDFGGGGGGDFDAGGSDSDNNGGGSF